jgi:hypothetical protein
MFFFFKYFDSLTNLCRLFLSCTIQTSSSSTSRIESVKYNQINRYLICGNNHSQDLFWNGTICTFINTL